MCMCISGTIPILWLMIERDTCWAVEKNHTGTHKSTIIVLQGHSGINNKKLKCCGLSFFATQSCLLDFLWTKPWKWLTIYKCHFKSVMYILIYLHHFIICLTSFWSLVIDSGIYFMFHFKVNDMYAVKVGGWG